MLKYTDEETVVLSVLNGIICSFFAPDPDLSFLFREPDKRSDPSSVHGDYLSGEIGVMDSQIVEESGSFCGGTEAAGQELSGESFLLFRA